MRPFSQHGHGRNGAPIYKTGAGQPSKRSQATQNAAAERNLLSGLAAKNDIRHPSQNSMLGARK